MINASFLHGVSRGHIDGQFEQIPAVWIINALTTGSISPLTIDNAIVIGPIDMQDGAVEKAVVFRNCSFSSFKMHNVEFKRTLAFDHCIIFDNLSFIDCRFSGSLVASHCEVFKDFQLTSTRVQYDVILSDLHIGKNLLSRSATIGMTLGLADVKIGGNLHADAATVEVLTLKRVIAEQITMHTARVGYFDTTDLIAHSIEAHYLHVRSTLHLPHARIRGHVDFMGSSITGVINVSAASIGGSLDLSASTFSNLTAHALRAAELVCTYGKFDGIELDEASFRKGIAIRNCECQGSVSLYALHCAGDVAIEGCNIGGWIGTAPTARFMRERGIRGASTDDAVLAKSGATLIQGALSIGGSTVGIQVQLANVFSASRMVAAGLKAQDVIIVSCTFGEILAVGLRAENNLTIDRTTIYGDFSLQNLAARSAVGITRSRIESIDLSNSSTGFLTMRGSIIGVVTLRQAEIRGPLYLDRCEIIRALGLRNARIDELFFMRDGADGIVFPDDVDMVGTEYAVIHANYPALITALRRTYPIKLGPLDYLSGYARSNGLPDVADDAFQAGREAQMLYYSSPLKTAWAQFRSIFSGFGVKPGRYAYGYAIGVALCFITGVTPGGLAQVGSAQRPAIVQSAGQRAGLSAGLALREGIPYVAKAQSGYVYSQFHANNVPLSANEVAGVGRLCQFFFGSLLIASLAGILRPAGGLKLS